MKNDTKKTIFWGVDFGGCVKPTIEEVVDELLIGKKGVQQKSTTIVTVNPELLLLADNDSFYKKAVASFDWKIVDGFGLRLMGALKNKAIPERFPGADLAGRLLKEAIKQKKEVALVFNKQGLSKKADLEKFLQKLGTKDVYLIEYDLCRTGKESYYQEINQKLTTADIVFVGLGMPHQELFIYTNVDKWKSTVLAMGVGGTFDFWCGTQKRAPKFLRKIGLEWCWRLITRPKRFVRIWRSTVIFVFKSLLKD